VSRNGHAKRLRTLEVTLGLDKDPDEDLCPECVAAGVYDGGPDEVLFKDEFEEKYGFNPTGDVNCSTCGFLIFGVLGYPDD
jgi:hypothetical protein